MRSQPYTSDIFYLILKVYKNVFTACVPRRGGEGLKIVSGEGEETIKGIQKHSTEYNRKDRS